MGFSYSLRHVSATAKWVSTGGPEEGFSSYSPSTRLRHPSYCPHLLTSGTAKFTLSQTYPLVYYVVLVMKSLCFITWYQPQVKLGIAAHTKATGTLGWLSCDKSTSCCFICECKHALSGIPGLGGASKMQHQNLEKDKKCLGVSGGPDRRSRSQ